MTSDEMRSIADSISSDRATIISTQLRQLGIEVTSIARHQINVRSSLAKSLDRTFPVTDTCRKNNGGVIDCLKDQNPALDKVVSFIPAAGASSRWLAPLVPLMDALRRQDMKAVQDALRLLVETHVSECPLPPSLLILVNYWRANGALPADWRADELLVDIDAPKALYPAVVDGTTFLAIKRAEDEAMTGLAGEIFISPPGREALFSERTAQAAKDPNLSCHVVAQGVQIGTVRFDRNGDVVLDDEGKVSIAPAGHGALLGTFAEIGKLFPKSDTIWIRNIDNVVGTSDEVIKASRDFLGTHRLILDGVKNIRLALNRGDRSTAGHAANQILEHWSDQVTLHGVGSTCDSQTKDPLEILLGRFFHAQDVETKQKHSIEDLKAIFARPVVTMGQVPNTARDIGGTCVFASVDGEFQKLCLELPHASEADRTKFLADPSKATHFNPVFVAAEIPDEIALKRWQQHPFWLVARKSWRGQEVWYQESILHEMLGSSKFTNLTFVEIPRILFNPHKGLADARGRKREDWLKF